MRKIFIVCRGLDMLRAFDDEDTAKAYLEDIKRHDKILYIYISVVDYDPKTS